MRIRSSKRTTGILILVVLLLFSAIFATSTKFDSQLVFAENNLLTDGFSDADSTAVYNESFTDWYFDEKYLNVEAVRAVVDSWRDSSQYDLQKLSQDPVVIAVIDSGIGYAYSLDDSGNEVKAAPLDVYNFGMQYKISPIFEDVLLRDEQGEYVYKSVVGNYTVKSSSKATGTTYQSVNNSGNIALDLVDNSENNHGTHVTGIVALMIKAFGLQDYIKILPIKANNQLVKSGSQYVAGYDNGDTDPVITRALQFALDNGADIVNLSLKGSSNTFYYSRFEDLLDDMLVVAASGNDGRTSAYYPAAGDKVVGVMNYMSSDNGATISSSSNKGDFYEIAAPGTLIKSVIDGNNTLGDLSGTSMASPIIAAAAAIAAVKYRALESETGIEISPSILRKMLTLSTNNYTMGTYAAPLLNLHRLLTLGFFSDPEFEDGIFVSPEGVKIVTDADVKQIVASGKTIKMRAQLLPSNSKTTDSIRWWYEFAGKVVELGTSWEVEFSVPNQVGSGYIVKCELLDKATGTRTYLCENPFDFSVNYIDVTASNITIVNDDYGKYSIKNYDSLNPVQSRYIVWYINGQAVSNEAVLDINNHLDVIENGNKTGGEYEYTVSVEVNGTLAEMTIKNRIEGNCGLDKSLYYVIAASCVAGILIVAGIICVLVSKRRKKRGLDKQAEFEEQAECPHNKSKELDSKEGIESRDEQEELDSQFIGQVKPDEQREIDTQRGLEEIDANKSIKPQDAPDDEAQAPQE